MGRETGHGEVSCGCAELKVSAEDPGGDVQWGIDSREWNWWENPELGTNIWDRVQTLGMHIIVKEDAENEDEESQDPREHQYVVSLPQEGS